MSDDDLIRRGDAKAACAPHFLATLDTLPAADVGALVEAAAAWRAFKDAATTDAHWAAVNRLDATLAQWEVK